MSQASTLPKRIQISVCPSILASTWNSPAPTWNNLAPLVGFS